MPTPSFELRAMRAAVQAGHVDWQRHALERLSERGISRHDVVQTLLNGERIEDYPDDYPFPSALFLDFRGGRPLHVVVAFNSSQARAAIITAYEPDSARFEDNFSTRRSP